MLKEILKTNKNEINIKDVSNLNNDNKVEKEDLNLNATDVIIGNNLNSKKQGNNQDCTNVNNMDLKGNLKKNNDIDKNNLI